MFKLYQLFLIVGACVLVYWIVGLQWALISGTWLDLKEGRSPFTRETWWLWPLFAYLCWMLYDVVSFIL